MKIKNKWLLAAAAIIMLGISWANADLSAFQQRSFSDFAPVLIITTVVFLIKTGVLSALLIAIKKLWDWLRRK